MIKWYWPKNQKSIIKWYWPGGWFPSVEHIAMVKANREMFASLGPKFAWVVAAETSYLKYIER